ncbi:MAG TPA: XRE family transcriptional regulator [Mariniphaga sp.]|nr:XRE family transcriptional regulator [Mariniphaga sp.]
MKRLGERIKRKRESLHMQLNELAAKVGVSASALSQIEKAKAFPSIVTLKSIADNLYTSVGELIGENEVLTNNPLVRFEDKSFVERNASGATLYLLSNHGNGKLMDTFLVDIEPGGSVEGIMKNHPGQEFCFLLKGRVEFNLDDKTYLLEKNDSFYFNSGRSHFVKNLSKRNSQFLLIVTPPEQ